MKDIKKYIILLFLLFIASLNFNLFLKQLNLVVGGNQGIALLLEYIFSFSPSITILVINIFMLILSYFFLDKKTTYGSLVSTFIYPLFVNITSNVSFFSINTLEPLIYVLLTGIICGITGGLIYKLGFSAGGISLLALFSKKYLKMEIGVTNFIINTVIILIGTFYFGLEKGLYSILVIFINSYFIQRILLGISRNKVIYIKSKNIDKISQELNKLELIFFHLKTLGGYTKVKEEMLLVIVSNKKYIEITNLIKAIDKNVFFSVNDSYEVSN